MGSVDRKVINPRYVPRIQRHTLEEFLPRPAHDHEIAHMVRVRNALQPWDEPAHERQLRQLVHLCVYAARDMLVAVLRALLDDRVQGRGNVLGVGIRSVVGVDDLDGFVDVARVQRGHLCTWESYGWV